MKMLQRSVFFFIPSCSSPNLPCIPSLFISTSIPSNFLPPHNHWQLKHPRRKKQPLLRCVSSSSYEVGGGYPDAEFDTAYKTQDTQNFDSSQYEALLKGGDQVTSVLEEIITLVSSALFSYYL